MGNQTKVELTVERRNEHQCLVSRMMCQNLCDFFSVSLLKGCFDIYQVEPNNNKYNRDAMSN